MIPYIGVQEWIQEIDPNKSTTSSAIWRRCFKRCGFFFLCGVFHLVIFSFETIIDKRFEYSLNVSALFGRCFSITDVVLFRKFFGFVCIYSSFVPIWSSSTTQQKYELTPYLVYFRLNTFCTVMGICFLGFLVSIWSIWKSCLTAWCQKLKKFHLRLCKNFLRSREIDPVPNQIHQSTK